MGQAQAHHALNHSQEMMRCTRYTLEGVVNSNGVAEEEKYQAQKAIENLIMGWNTIEIVTRSRERVQQNTNHTTHNGHHVQRSSLLYSPHFGPQYIGTPQNFFAAPQPQNIPNYQQFGPAPF